MSQVAEQMTSREFPCPRCKKPVQWTNNPFRPFCSERCKMIDLGAWANEDYRVATNESQQQDDFEQE